MSKIAVAAGRRNPGINHELWLAMQSAYDRYKNASAALVALQAVPLDAVVGAKRESRIEAAASLQRTAFENYIEARLQLSEGLLSTSNVDPMDPQISDGPLLWRGITMPAKILAAVVAAFLLPATFGLGYLAHKQIQSPGLEAENNRLNRALDQTRKQMQVLALQVKALKSTNQGRARSASVTRIKTRKFRLGQAPALSVASGGRRTLRSQPSVAIRERTLGEQHYFVMPQKHSDSQRADWRLNVVPSWRRFGGESDMAPTSHSSPHAGME